MAKHRMHWYVYVGTEKIRRSASMRGMWGYDVECADCLWMTHTGGGTLRYIRSRIEDHQRDVELGMVD